jgi:parallel beta-helix repeat protein
MDKKGRVLVICATILVLIFVGTASARTWIVDDDGGGDFSGIQEAINNASAGDTILVHSGVYYEPVYVNKSVTLKGIGQPVVDANGSGSAFTLNADGITLEGFNATNSGRLWVSLWIGTGITVVSSNNTITGNNVCNNKNDGIDLFPSSNNNTITGNTFVNNGLTVFDSYQNTVEDNTVNGKPLVYLEDASDYTVEDAGQVILVNCTNITVENLELTNTSVGIGLLNTEDSKVLNNTVSNNGDGISLWNSYNNSITGNNVNGNKMYGISLPHSSNNTIIGNSFVNCGLLVWGSDYQNTVEDNIVNGKPLLYLVDSSDYKVEDAGQVILVNCTNITVEGQDLFNIPTTTP